MGDRRRNAPQRYIGNRGRHRGPGVERTASGGSHRFALEQPGALGERVRVLDAAEEDYLEVLGDLVERYEEEHHPIGEVPEAEMLRFLMDQKAVKLTEVARATGIA